MVHLLFSFFSISQLQAMPTRTKQRRDPPKVIVMTPTRELALQILKEFQAVNSVRSVFIFFVVVMLTANTPYQVASHLRFVAVYGGASYSTQERGLWAGADVVVGTPGRIVDLHDKGL